MFLTKYVMVVMSLLSGLYSFVEVHVLSLFKGVEIPNFEFTPLVVEPEAVEEIPEEIIDMSPIVRRYGYPKLDPQTQILPGELPGYTGWARPAKTYVDEYTLDFSPPTVEAGNYYKTTVTCHHAACANGGALFDLRAYGPASIPGRTRDYHNGTYDFSFYFFDEGTYYVEAVLAFSNPPHFSTYPLDEEPMYEGYLLPHFPIFVKVVAGARPVVNSLQRCAMDDFMDRSHIDAIEKGRWVFKERFRGNEAETNITWFGYKNGVNSIGYSMDYVRTDCAMEPLPELKRKLTGQQKHLVMIGDSNMRIQFLILKVMRVRAIDLSIIATSDGLMPRMDEIKASVRELTLNHTPDKKMLVIFNSGLHDIAKLCSQKWAHAWQRAFEDADVIPKCGDLYVDLMKEAVSVIKTLPADLFLWQSTSSGWAKWGNYGFEWQPDLPQTLPLHPHVCEYFNFLARPIVQEAGFLMMDNYWLTNARPEHKEVGPNNEVGKHLVHGGPENYDVLLRMLFSIILEKFENYDTRLNVGVAL